MRFARIRMHAMGPFKGDVDVDLSHMDGQLVAICGPNGAGKTTLLELLAGALYRECPTRGTLAELATARDSFVEVHAVNGEAFTVRQHIDGISKKGETLVLGADGETPLVESAKVSHFDKWAADHIMPADVLYSSSFAVQGRRGFLDLKPGERKDLLIEVLGLKRLDRMADNARERAREAKVALETLHARLADVKAPDMAALEEQVACMRGRVEKSVEAVRVARVALERARAAAGDAARQAELAEQRRAAEKRLGAARKQLSELEERLTNNRALLGRADEVRAAVARAAELDALIEAARAASRDADQTFTAAKATENDTRAAHQRALDAVGQAQSRVARVQTRLKDRVAVSNAVARVEELRGREVENDACLDATEGMVSTLEQMVLGGKDRRLGGLRSGLQKIAGGAFAPSLGAGAEPYAFGVLRGDDELAAQLDEAPKELDQTRAQVTKLRDVQRQLRTATAEAQKLAARTGEIAQAEADMEQARAEEATASTQLASTSAARDAAAAERATANSAAELAEEKVTTLRSERFALDPTLALRPRLDQAEARIEELTAGLEPARGAVADAEAELATLPVVDAAAAVDVSAYERGLKDAELTERTVRDDMARADMATERAQEAIKARESIQAQVAAAEDNLSDWTRLALDLGKDGLQAMEIDSALPEWTAISNHLLHSCLGSRFTIDLRTDRLSADGKKVIEDLEARVIDTVNGRDADATTYSGGELVLVGSALSLGLTTLACRRSGIERPTICLDEAGAALDEANGRAWIAMLRMAAKQIGADKVLYISHSSEAQGLADARIRIADGVVTVD